MSAYGKPKANPMAEQVGKAHGLRMTITAGKPAKPVAGIAPSDARGGAKVVRPAPRVKR